MIPKVLRDDLLTQSAALAFYAGFAIAPLVILLTGLLGSLQLDLQFHLIGQIRDLMGTEAATVLESIINTADGRPELLKAANWWGLIMLGISASVIFAQLQLSMNIIFESPEVDREDLHIWQQALHFIVRRFVCFFMVMAFVCIAVVSLILSALLATAFSGSLEWARIIHPLLSFIVFTLLFTALFRWMPDREVTWQASFNGGLLTALLFMIGKALISLYLSKIAIGSAYGAAGSLLVFFAWIYYSSLIMLFGAEVSAALDNSKRGSRSALGTPSLVS